MTRKLWLALTVPGVFLVLVAGSGLAEGRVLSHESAQAGESMSSEFGTMGENWVPSGSSGERLEFSEYGREEALETGRLPEREVRSETIAIFGHDVDRQLRAGSVPGGP